MSAYDELTGREMTLVSFHLVSGVQVRGVYGDDRSRLVARHRREAAQLSALVQEARRTGGYIFVAGDSNFHGFQLEGLSSAWEHGLGTTGGTFGGRFVDDVFSLTRPSAITLLHTGSDHLAVLADFMMAD